MIDPPSIQLIATPDFQAQLRKLVKRYRNLRQDLHPSSMNFKMAIVQAIKSLAQPTLFSKSVSKIVIFKKAKAQATESFINEETTFAFYS
jgi:hypothetical protein